MISALMARLTILLAISPKRFDPVLENIPIEVIKTEIMSMAIPINNTIIDIVQAHPFPFHNPLAMTRFATPSANYMASNSRKILV